MQIKRWKERKIKLGVSFTGAMKLGLFTPNLSKAIKKKVEVLWSIYLNNARPHIRYFFIINFYLIIAAKSKEFAISNICPR